MFSSEAVSKTLRLFGFALGCVSYSLMVASSLCPQLQDFCSARLEATPDDVCAVDLILTWLWKEASTAFPAAPSRPEASFPSFPTSHSFCPLSAARGSRSPGQKNARMQAGALADRHVRTGALDRTGPGAQGRELRGRGRAARADP